MTLTRRQELIASIRTGYEGAEEDVQVLADLLEEDGELELALFLRSPRTWVDSVEWRAPSRWHWPDAPAPAMDGGPVVRRLAEQLGAAGLSRLMPHSSQLVNCPYPIHELAFDIVSAAWLPAGGSNQFSYRAPRPMRIEALGTYPAGPPLSRSDLRRMAPDRWLGLPVIDRAIVRGRQLWDPLHTPLQRRMLSPHHLGMVLWPDDDLTVVVRNPYGHAIADFRIVAEGYTFPRYL